MVIRKVLEKDIRDLRRLIYEFYVDNKKAYSKTLQGFEEYKDNKKVVEEIAGKYLSDKKYILFDADKMEYVNPLRLSWFLRAYKEQLVSEEKYKQYKKEWNERITKVKEMLHFNYSKEKFLKFLPQAEKIMKS